MRNQLSFLTVAGLAAAVVLSAQTQTRGPRSMPEQPATTAAQRAGRAPTDADVYCAGFFTRRAISPELIVLGGEENGLKFEFGDRDIVYLNKGAEVVKSPGAKYMLLRPMQDVDSTEPFPGQRNLVKRLGTHYAEIARIQVNVVHGASSTAEISHSCEPVEAGDIAVPFSERPAPPYRVAKLSDRFAPASGKATGLIASVKDFQEIAGSANVVYLNLGAKQNVHPGDYLRIFRTYQSPSQYIVELGTREYPTEMMGVPIGRKLKPAEIGTLPRNIVGELMVLSVQEESSTGIVTYSWEDIYPGDQVEIE